jgi:hypothetical protein
MLISLTSIYSPHVTKTLKVHKVPGECAPMFRVS